MIQLTAAGKSTLLKIIRGMDHFDNGNLTTGYLPQDGLSLSGRKVELN